MATYEENTGEYILASTLNSVSGVMAFSAADVFSAYGDIGTLCEATTSLVSVDTVKRIDRLIGTATEEITLSDICLSVVLLSDAVTESLTVSGEENISVAIGQIVESVASSTEAMCGTSMSVEITQKISINTSFLMSLYASIIDGISTSCGTENYVNRIYRCSERVGVDCSVDTIIKAMCPLAVSILIDEAILSGKGISVSEGMMSVDNAGQKIKAFISKLEQAIINDSLLGSGKVGITVDSAILIDDVLSGKSLINRLVNDGVNFQLSFDNGGYVWTGWCMNADNFGVSSYGEYPFNSFAKIAGKYYGANANGLYLLEGDSDDGAAIQASVMLAATDFDEPRKGTIRDAWLGLRSDGEVFLKTVADDNKERWYRANATNEHLDRTRVKLARGVRSNYWQVGLENIDGSDFELSNIELIHVVLSRH